MAREGHFLILFPHVQEVISRMTFLRLQSHLTSVGGSDTRGRDNILSPSVEASDTRGRDDTLSLPSDLSLPTGKHSFMTAVYSLTLTLSRPSRGEERH